MSLPPEIWDIIFSFVSLTDLLCFRRVCKQWYKIVNRRILNYQAITLQESILFNTFLILYSINDTWKNDQKQIQKYYEKQLNKKRVFVRYQLRI